MASQIEKRTIAISLLLPGKVYQSLGDTSFVIARKAGEGFEIEIGRVVPESYSDDFMSHTYHPFKNRRKQPWAGRLVKATTAAEAARLFGEFCDIIATRSKLPAGEPIGSVSREARNG